jgi:hypothetical protein
MHSELEFPLPHSPVHKIKSVVDMQSCRNRESTIRIFVFHVLFTFQYKFYTVYTCFRFSLWDVLGILFSLKYRIAYNLSFYSVKCFDAVYKTTCIYFYTHPVYSNLINDKISAYDGPFLNQTALLTGWFQLFFLASNGLSESKSCIQNLWG